MSKIVKVYKGYERYYIIEENLKMGKRNYVNVLDFFKLIVYLIVSVFSFWVEDCFFGKRSLRLRFVCREFVVGSVLVVFGIEGLLSGEIGVERCLTYFLIKF